MLFVLVWTTGSRAEIRARPKRSDDGVVANLFQAARDPLTFRRGTQRAALAALTDFSRPVLFRGTPAAGSRCGCSHTLLNGCCSFPQCIRARNGPPPAGALWPAERARFMVIQVGVPKI